jgi:hypothetical protein
MGGVSFKQCYLQKFCMKIWLGVENIYERIKLKCIIGKY